jgi:hypothetical protein
MVAPKRCVYCKGEVPEARAMDVCNSCGRRVWGEKMFQCILDSTNSEMEKGNLELGRVSESHSSSGAGEIQDLHKNLKDAQALARKK